MTPSFGQDRVERKAAPHVSQYRTGTILRVRPFPCYHACLGSTVKDLTDGESTALRVRLDKWLWAARFFKTRSQASDAIHGGHVKGGGDRLKAGHALTLGEIVTISKGGIVWEVEVMALSDRRGSGADAQRLYRETEDGKARRLAHIEAARIAAASAPYLKGRPTKRDRRALDTLRAGVPRLPSSHRRGS